MIGLRLPSGSLSLLCLGAHPDDVEIGCGGTLLALREEREVQVDVAVLTGTLDRQREAVVAAEAFSGITEENVRLLGLRDGRLPAQWDEVKQSLEDLAADVSPQVVLAPRPDDAHQDHRLLAQLVTTVWRDALVLQYEIPKWDGDHGSATHYVPLTGEQARRKVELLSQCFPSQKGRGWWDEELFLGLMRLRGMECRARYAEAYVVSKALIDLGAE